jgi:hypothetical protein
MAGWVKFLANAMVNGVFPLPPTVRFPMLMTGIGGFLGAAKRRLKIAIKQTKRLSGNKIKAKPKPRRLGFMR